MKYFILKDIIGEELIREYSNHFPNSLALQEEEEAEKNRVLSLSKKEYYTLHQYHYLENLIPLTLIGVN